jgi:2'-hydroxyisoflavone reductase
MRALVIGGTQFMGRGIVERLVARGHEVTVLHRSSHHDLGPTVRNLRADRGDRSAVAAHLRQGRFEVIFDMAYDWSKGTSAADVEAAARSAGDHLHRYVFMSSIAAYGPGLNHIESESLAPDDAGDLYTAHKASTERMLFGLHAEIGLPVTTFRPPFVHGPRQPFYREQFFWDRLRAGRPIVLPDGGSAPMQWAFVDDVAEACVRAIEVPKSAGEAFNIGHAATTQRGFVELLGRVAGCQPRFVNVPRAQIHAAGGQLLGPNAYFGDYLDLLPHTEVVEKAPRVLGVSPTDFDAALAAGFAWYLLQPQRQVDHTVEDRLLA